jgi:hypothetical protein
VLSLRGQVIVAQVIVAAAHVAGPTARRVGWARILLVGAVALAGCSSSADPVLSPSVPSFSASTSRAAPTSTRATPALPADCGSLISSQNVDLALGKPLVGRIRGIVGVPEPKIKRLERVTCQYGLPDPPPPGPAPPVPLEISVARYADEASAAARLEDTVQAERARGAAPTTVPVGAVHGTVLVTPDRRLLVAASGAITLAVTLAPGIADDRTTDVLSDLGGRVLTAVT